MRSLLKLSFIWSLYFLSVYISDTASSKNTFGKKHVVFDIDRIAFQGDLPAGATLIPDRNIIKAIKVHKGIVYVTIPRHGQTGIPATLANINKTAEGKVLFTPFPNWEFQALGACKMLQDVRSIEVDPKTDLLYIADNGDGQNCDPKLVIYNLAKNSLNATYPLKDDRKGGALLRALGDIVVDKQGIVYIANSDTFGSMWIVNTRDGQIYHVQDHSFRGTEFRLFAFENDTYASNMTINMLALTPDNKILFYSSHDQDLWQIESDFKKQKRSWEGGDMIGARITGKKKHHGFSILMGNRYLFFSNTDNKSISYWDRQLDLDKQNQGETALVKENEKTIDIQPKLQLFPGKMALDENGYLWVVTMDLAMFFNESKTSDFTTKIVKIFVDNKPYNAPEMTVSGSGSIFLSALIVLACCLLAAV